MFSCSELNYLIPRKNIKSSLKKYPTCPRVVKLTTDSCYNLLSQSQNTKPAYTIQEFKQSEFSDTVSGKQQFFHKTSVQF
jgi:hypothetical protein